MVTGSAPVSRLPEALYTADQVRALDSRAIETFGVPGFDLMQRAGRSAFRQLLRHWPLCKRVVVLCGGGNNGGDGYLVAGLALRQGLHVDCLAVSDPAKLKGDAHRAYEWAGEQGVEVLGWNSLADDRLRETLARADVIVDAMLGTGLKGAVRDDYRGILKTVREAQRPVLAVDIPSGVCADTGSDLGDALPAELTATFIGLKVGLLTGQGPDFTGQLAFDDLSVDAGVYEGIEPVAERVDWTRAARDLPRRRPAAHKGDCGRILVVGGDQGMGGAGILAATAALRGGAGLVHLATRKDHVTAALSRRPELLVHAVEHRNDLEPLLDAVDVLVLGPGLGRQAWGEQMLQRCLEWEGPLVVDADALNMLAARGQKPRRENWILTPHPGEAARLLDSDAGTVNRNRLESAAALQSRYGGVALLKGAGTIVAGAGRLPALIDAGNPGMASGGMGDVLSGLIGALLGQGHDPFRAARLGAALHGRAADEAARQKGYMGLVAGDLIDAVPACCAAVELG
ncbi:NAD(P)H-hydrate dehydratase [Marinobacteraceae bacterium S3BR75-40.1]